MNISEYEITIQSNISKYNEDIIESLNSYFGSSNNTNPTPEMSKILPILQGQSKISIRVIDWFVTNYSKKDNIIYPLVENNNIISKYFNVYLEYKAQLKGYKKKLFDPFCRKRRIPFYYTSNNYLITTIGQLNFFRWAISNKVLDYVEKYLDDINRDMSDTLTKKSPNNSTDKQSSTNSINSITDLIDSPSSSEKKRHELSKNASKSINCYKMKIILDMN